MASEAQDDVEIIIIIRFSTSISDLRLPIRSTTLTTAGRVKHLIRCQLPDHLARRHLRLIHSGKPLDDKTSLSASLRLPTLLPSSSPVPRVSEVESRDKGKAPLRDPPEPTLRSKQPLQIYIHCAISDLELSLDDLATEIRSATPLPSLSIGSKSGGGSSPGGGNETSVGDGSTTTTLTPSSAIATQMTATTTPAPQGFDRLLATGFTAAEVSTLRSQFLALQSLTHTPDTMPSVEELRRLEDRWMDEGSGAGGEGGFLAGDGSTGTTDEGVAGGLDDMLWGAVMGFFWPVGCGLWLLREEGVWSWRKGLSVFVGVVLNFLFGSVTFLG